MKNDYQSSLFPWRGKFQLKKMLLSIPILLLSLISYGQLGPIQVGSGNAVTTSTGTSLPITNFNYAYSQQIVTAAEYGIGGGANGSITKLRYFFTVTPTPTNWNNWTVYIGNTTKTSFTSVTDWVPVTAMDQVFSGTINPVANSWSEITFTTPFNYTGGNIVIAIHENTPGWLGGPTTKTYTSAANTGILYRNDTNNPDPATPPAAESRTANLPQLQFEGTLSSCPPPSALNLTALTDNSASLAWTEVGTATDWDVEYGPIGFTPTGTPTNAGVSNPFNLSGLTSNTSYSYYVRSSCSATETSAWVGPYTFTTPCVAASIPFFEGFETGYTHNVDLAGCWSQEIPTGTKKWKTNNTLTTYNRSPRTGAWDATLEYSGESWMFQGINLVAGTNYMVKFYARQDATTVGGAKISAHFGATPSAAAMSNVVVPSTDLTNGNYQEMIGYFSPTTSGIYYLGIHGIKTSANYYLTLDDISVIVAPTCAAPAQLAISNLSDNSVDLSWLENGTATDWDIEYGIAGFTPTGAPSVSVTSNPATITGLNPNTSYEYYVRSVCSPTDQSTWQGPFAFTTPCVAASIPFFEGFETGYNHDAELAGCWTQVQPTLNNKWMVNNTFTTYNRSPRTGAWDATLRYSGDSWMFQGVNLTAGIQYRVKFYARQDGAPLTGATVSAYFGTAATQAAMTDVAIAEAGVTDGEYQEFLGFYTPTTSGVFYFGIHGYKTSANWYLTIDDISIVVAPTCIEPSDLTVNAITSSSAELEWTENNSITDWDIEYGVTGFTPTGVPTLSTTTNPVLITGLTDNTEYDFYVRSLCSLTDSSFWSGPYTFVTQCGPISAIGFCEDFEDGSATLDCWSVLDENNDGDEWSIYSGYSNSGTKSAGLKTDFNGGDNDDYLITPNLIMTGNEVMKFSYRARTTGEPNDFQVLLSTTGSSPADFTDTLMHLAQYNNATYKDTVLDLSAYTGNVYIAFHVPAGGLDGYYLYIDDVCFDICIPTAGISGTQNICSLTNTIDLNTVITQGETNGAWSYSLNPSALNGSDVTIAALPYGTSTFNYIVTTGCTSDTTTAAITVVKPSSAGNDGSLAVCRNQPFNLLSGLSGSVDLGGVWTDPNAAVVPNGNVNANNIPGQYNFKYIVSNGVCPADTAKVVVNVQGCDYLGLEDVAFEGFSLYPNPTSDLIYVVNSGSTEVFNYEVLDMNGRVILKANQAINGSTTTEINLNQVEVGVYMVRVFNENAEKTFRVVKN